MKGLILVAAACLSGYAASAQPSPRTNFHLHHRPLREFLDLSGTLIKPCLLITSGLPKEYDTITVHLDHATFRQALDKVFHHHPVKDSAYTKDGYCFVVILPIPQPPVVQLLDTAEVAVNNGFYTTLPASLPGSFSRTGRADLNQVVSYNLLDHFAYTTSGIYFGPGTGNPLGIAIRGRSTFSSYSSPLVIQDNFPIYNLLFINPDDISAVTVLKDAAAAGIWGSFSANNVLVLTSQEGSYRQAPVMIVTWNTVLTAKPDLYYQPWLSPKDNINAEQLFYQSGALSASYGEKAHIFTPAAQLLRAQPASLQAQLSALSGHDLFDDLSKYFYRTSLSQQMHFCRYGGTARDRYYWSLGYDYDPTTLVRNRNDRYTFRVSNSFLAFKKKLEITTIGSFTGISILDNNPGNIPVFYSYASLADAKGQPLAVPFEYNPYFIDTAGHGQLLDWHYRPLQELRLADHHISRINAYAQADLTWHFGPVLSASLLYRYMRSWSSDRNRYDPQSFYVRDQWNTALYLDGGPATAPRAIRVVSDTATVNNDARFQFRLVGDTSKHPRYTAFAGAELSDRSITGSAINPQSLRYLSAFANLSANVGHLFSLYGSCRIDGTNFVGVDIDKKWMPFWSVAMNRQLLDTLPRAAHYPNSLNLRASFGYDGNVSNRTAELLTQPLSTNMYGVMQSGIASAADPGLTWEKIGLVNIGLDFTCCRDSLHRSGRLSGSLDVYTKDARNLLGNDTLSPSSGILTFWGNTAGIRGYGLDLVVHSINTTGKLGWTTGLLFSIARDWVSSYQSQPTSPSSYVSGNYPKVGKAPAGLYSYRYGPLKHDNGDPQGYLNGQLSSNYTAIMNTSQDGYQYDGSYQPVLFGNLLNTITLGQWSFSVRLTYRGDFYFRRSSIDYYDMAQGTAPGHRDFNRRWVKPGDEGQTYIPSVNINDPSRSTFYLASEPLVSRGDYIRVQDCRLCYTLVSDSRHTLPFRQANIYAYASNLGMLWRANHYGIDPDAPGIGDLPAPKTFALGMQVML